MTAIEPDQGGDVFVFDNRDADKTKRSRRSRLRDYGGACYRARADWQSRTGTVAKYSRDKSLAYVVWEGTRYFDRVSVDLIEPA